MSERLERYFINVSVRLVAVALMCVMPFCLALSGHFQSPWCGVAFAEEGFSSDVDPSDPDPVDPEPDDPAPVYDGINDIGIYYLNTDTCVGETTYPNRRDVPITEKGGKLQFYTVSSWDDWSTTTDDYRVQWATTDSSVFRVYGGMVEATGNGTAQLIAYINSSDNPNGSYVEAVATIYVSGQEDAFYVTNIRIADSDGNEIPAGEPHIVTGDLSTAMEQFYALVDVYDIATGTVSTYSTANGPMSSQIPGMGDVQWYVGDPAMSSVESDAMPGLWRPAVYGISSLYAYTNAGEGNSRVSASVTVTMRDPNGGTQSDEYHPQNSLTVLAYYEMYPPEDMRDHDDPKFVINKEYSLDELSVMGSVTATYTAFGSGTYYTMTGQGVPLATVLSEAGINLDGAKTIQFGTADLLDRSVSVEYVFDTNRYYFPNIDMLSFADAQQVYPILAFVSNISKNAGTEPDYNMSEATRFRLLFGSTTEGGSSSYQVKWIHTLYVMLYGAPAVDDGDGEGGGGGEGGEGGGSGGDEGDGTGGGDEGSNAGGGPADASESNAQEGASGGTGGTDSGTASSTGTVAQSATERQFQIYQMMNRADSDTEALDYSNPYAPAAGLGGGLAFAAGCLYSLRWFRRQTLPIPSAASGMPAST